MKKYILPRDMLSLQKKRDDLLVELREISTEIQESLTQSSETYHDNAPFEALIDREKNISKRLDELAQILEDSEEWVESAPDTIAVGHRVVFQVGDDLREYIVTGHYSDPENYAPYKVVSSHSPLGQQIIGKSIDDTFVPELPSRDTTPWLVVSVQNIEVE